MSDYFGTPMTADSVDIQSEYPLQINYKALKTDSTFTSMVDENFIKSAQANGKLGFVYYDKDEKRNFPLETLTIAIVEVYSGIEGNDKNGDDFVRIYSNRVKNTQQEPLVVYRSDRKEPVGKGIYAEIKPMIHPGKFKIFLQAYCLELDRHIEIGLGGYLQQGIQESIAKSLTANGHRTMPRSVNCFSLADGDTIRGLRFTGKFNKVDEKGKPYEGVGAMFMVPEFEAGLIQPVGPQAELHRKAVNLQTQIRGAYEAKKAKYADKNPVPPAQPAPNTTDVSEFAQPARQEPESDYFAQPKQVPMPHPNDVLKPTTQDHEKLKKFTSGIDAAIGECFSAEELLERANKVLAVLERPEFTDLTAHTPHFLGKFDDALRTFGNPLAKFVMDKSKGRVTIGEVQTGPTKKQKAVEAVEGFLNPSGDLDLPF